MAWEPQQCKQWAGCTSFMPPENVRCRAPSPDASDPWLRVPVDQYGLQPVLTAWLKPNSGCILVGQYGLQPRHQVLTH
eukprot:scaffold3765_cov22-Tisochrysis_lutea.AAC.7